jgi:hypothetical protein
MRTISFFIINTICRALVAGRRNTTTDRLDVAARLSRLAAQIRTTPCTVEVTR